MTRDIYISRRRVPLAESCYVDSVAACHGQRFQLACEVVPDTYAPNSRRTEPSCNPRIRHDYMAGSRGKSNLRDYLEEKLLAWLEVVNALGDPDEPLLHWED
jgi:hypothetical protein